MDKVVERYAKLYEHALAGRGFADVDGMVAAYRERLRQMYASDAYREHDVYPTMSVQHVYAVIAMCLELKDLAAEPERSREFLFENRLNLPTLVHYKDGLTVQLEAFVTDEWIKGLFALNGTSDPALRRIVPKMYAAIPKKTIAASVEIDGRMVASGLGIRDRDWVGIYAVYVSPSCWSRGYARAVCSTILREAGGLGAKRAYLQVASSNQKARSLYESLGFSDFYSYWFRSKET